MSDPDSAKNGLERGKRSLAVRVGKLVAFFGILCMGAGFYFSADFAFGHELTVSDFVGGPIEVAMWKFGLGILLVGVLILANAVRCYGFFGVFERPRWR